MPGGCLGYLPSAVPVQFMVDLSKFSGWSCWSSRDIEAACVTWQVPSEDGIHEAPDSVEQKNIKDVVGVEQKWSIYTSF